MSLLKGGNCELHGIMRACDAESESVCFYVKRARAIHGSHPKKAGHNSAMDGRYYGLPEGGGRIKKVDSYPIPERTKLCPPRAPEPVMRCYAT